MPAAFRKYLHVLFVVGVVQICGFVTAAHAQGPAADQPPAPAAPAQPATPPAAQTAKPPAWSRSTTISVLMQSGATDQFGFTLSGRVARPSRQLTDTTLEPSPYWGFAFQTDLVYSRVKVSGQDVTVADSQDVRFFAERDIAPRIFLAFQPSYKRNMVQKVDYRVEGLAGVGFKVVNESRVKANVIPVIGLVSQDKNIPAVDGTTGTGGVFESVQAQLTRAWAFSHTFLFLEDFNEGIDHRIQFMAGLTGAITSHLAMSVNYTLDRENVVVTTSDKSDRRFTVGLQVNF